MTTRLTLLFVCSAVWGGCITVGLQILTNNTFTDGL